MSADDTTTATDLRHAAEITQGITLPDTGRLTGEIAWHDCSIDDLRTIMAAFPDANWRANSGTGGSTTEWIAARFGNVVLTAFAADPEPTVPRRLPSALFAETDAELSR